MALKVLQAIAGGEQGGAETAFVDTVLALKRAGLGQEVVVRQGRKWAAPLKEAGLIVHELPFGGLFDFSTKARLKKIITAYQPEIVQTWMTRATKFCPPKNNFVHVARLGGYYNLKSYKSCDYLIANTPDIERYLNENNWPQSHTRTLWNFAPIEPATENIPRSKFQTPDHVPLLLALGRLHPNKAFDTLLKALIHVPEAYLWIAGEGEERAALENLAQKLQVSNRVRFLGWQNNRAGLFAAADICVFPSRHEPFGNVGIQAWAYKVPLVATASEGPKQYTTPGQDALVVEVDNVEELGKAINQLVHDRSLRSRLAENGYRQYLQRFSEKAVVKTYLDFYQKISNRN